MSPEQAELNNADIDTRTDIYSLGALLYELLSGTTLVEKHRFSEVGLDEMLRWIKETDPPLPSSRLQGHPHLHRPYGTPRFPWWATTT